MKEKPTFASNTRSSCASQRFLHFLFSVCLVDLFLFDFDALVFAWVFADFLLDLPPAFFVSILVDFAIRDLCAEANDRTQLNTVLSKNKTTKNVLTDFFGAITASEADNEVKQHCEED